MVKFAGGRNGRNNEDRAGNTAFATTCRGVAHSDILLALTLRNVSRGTTLIELNGRNTSKSDHHSGFFFRRVTYGARSHGTVSLEQNHGTVGLDAHTGSGIVSAVARFGNDYLAVPNHGYQSIHGFQDLHRLSLLGALVGLSLSQSRAFLKHINGTVVKSGNIGTVRVVVVHHTVHHQIA